MLSRKAKQKDLDLLDKRISIIHIYFDI